MTVTGNRFTNIQKFIQDLDSLSFCEMLASTNNDVEFTIWESNYSWYFQFTHMISLKYLSYSSIQITDNLFHNLSSVGSQIYFEEDIDQYSTGVVIAKNNFTLIHTYAGPATIQLKREYFPSMTPNQNISQSLKYVLSGGNFLI